MKTNKIFYLLLVFSISLAVISCSGDDSKDSTDEDSEFAGAWQGTYSGDDSGTFQINISNSGKITGSGFSNGDSASFSINGDVDEDGDFTASLGSTSTGATFTGSISGNSMSGSWSNPTSGDSGTFSGTRSGNN